jgi:hypothetical protein
MHPTRGTGSYGVERNGWLWRRQVAIAVRIAVSRAADPDDTWQNRCQVVSIQRVRSVPGRLYTENSQLGVDVDVGVGVGIEVVIE